MRLSIAFASCALVAPVFAASVPVWTRPNIAVNGTAQSNTTNTDSGLTLIYTSAAPKPPAPVSQAISYNGFLFVSGQLPEDPQTGEVVGDDIESQTRLALSNLQQVLNGAGSSMGKVIMCHAYLKNIDDYAKFSEVYGEFFGDHKPARVALSVANIPTGALVEIEATAKA